MTTSPPRKSIWHNSWHGRVLLRGLLVDVVGSFSSSAIALFLDSKGNVLKWFRLSKKVGRRVDKRLRSSHTAFRRECDTAIILQWPFILDHEITYITRYGTFRIYSDRSDAFSGLICFWRCVFCVSALTDLVTRGYWVFIIKLKLYFLEFLQ